MNLAGTLLLGSKQLIISVLPHHQTDAIVRIENLDRYDDRDTICENLVESYTRLMTFVKKHLSDPFYLEGEQRVSLRNVIFREIGLADKLGSGIRNVNKYMKIYSGEKPQFVEGNIFKMLLPLGKNSSNKKNVYHGERHTHQVSHQVSHQVAHQGNQQEVIEKLLAFCEIERRKKYVNTWDIMI
jgi:predicted HTH transcriptional regulator